MDNEKSNLVGKTTTKDTVVERNSVSAPHYVVSSGTSIEARAITPETPKNIPETGLKLEIEESFNEPSGLPVKNN